MLWEYKLGSAVGVQVEGCCGSTSWVVQWKCKLGSALEVEVSMCCGCTSLETAAIDRSKSETAMKS